MENTILVVEDEEPIRLLYKNAFEKQGYTVLTAEDGITAIEILSSANVQVMFLDLGLPGMDGVELCRKIRSTHPIAIISAVTGYASLFELADCREAGFDDYFIKPVNLPTLFKAAEDAFDRLMRWKTTGLYSY
ncbi:MAG: response regulator [Desulfobulbaceae bacterium]|nr:response regulator [Desulfobulbaceae bacterium]